MDRGGIAKRLNAWVATLEPHDTGVLAGHRLAGIEALAHGAELWLRGQGEIPRGIPWKAIYELHGAETLRLAGHLLSAGKLPAGAWQKLADYVRPERPPTLHESLPPGRVPLRLVPAAEPQPAALLLATAAQWLEFAAHAPEVRLNRLRFAQTETGRVFISGKPLPSIPGDYFTEEDHIAAPAGSTWAPKIPAGSVRTALGLADGEMAVFLPDGTWLRIPPRAWQKATRAAVRLLAEALSHES